MALEVCFVSDFLLSLVSLKGPKVLEYPRDIDISQPLPTKRVFPGRTYSHVVFDPTSCHAVAAGLFSVKYELFDEDDQKVRSKTGERSVFLLVGSFWG